MPLDENDTCFLRPADVGIIGNGAKPVGDVGDEGKDGGGDDESGRESGAT